MLRLSILAFLTFLCINLSVAQQYDAPKNFAIATDDYKVPSFALISESKLVKQTVKSLEQKQWVTKSVEIDLNATVPAEASPTPIDEVRRILSILKPKPDETIVDWGCGDARFLIEAAKTYGCKGIGIEIDLYRAALAQRLVDEADVNDRVNIYHADATKVNVIADIGVAYLYKETLQKLLPKIRKLNRFASYMHEVPGLSMTKNGDSYVWRRESAQAYQPKVAIWNGRTYTSPVCNNPFCRMCNSIRQQLYK